jgi:hypothetical protein
VEGCTWTVAATEMFGGRLEDAIISWRAHVDGERG